jgi:hypothetical protein
MEKKVIEGSNDAVLLLSGHSILLSEHERKLRNKHNVNLFLEVSMDANY